MKKFLFLLLVLEILLVGLLVLAPDSVSAQATLPNPLGGVDNPSQLVTRLISFIAGFAGLIAVVFVVVSGFRMVMATNEEALTQAKRSLTWSVGGFIVSILAFTIVSGVANLIGFREVERSGAEIQNPLGQDTALESVARTVLVNFLGLLGFAATLMIVYYGYRYIMAAGNEEELKKAKEGLKWAVIGFVVTILAFTIIAGIRRLFPF